MEIQSYINNEDKDKKFNSIVKSVGIMQLAMYSREVLKKVKEQSEGKKEEQKDRIELGIMYQALNRIKFFDKSIKFHNQKYKIFETNDNVNYLNIDIITLEDIYLKTQNDTQIENLVKKTQLENRFAKLCKYGRNELIKRTSKGKPIENVLNEYKKAFKEIAIKGDMEDFLDSCFKYYYKKEISTDEFNNLESVKICNKTLNQKESKIGIKEVYTYSLYEYTHNKLMYEKNKDINRIIKIYAKEKELGLPSFDIATKRDARIKGPMEMGLVINLPNYICPFKMHVSEAVIEDAEKENNIQINKQFRKYPIEPILPLKIPTDKIYKIQEQTKQGAVQFKDKRSFSNETRREVSNYIVNNLFLKQEHTRQQILNKIKIIKSKEKELAELTQEIEAKKEKAKELQKDVKSLKIQIEENLERD